MEQLGVDRLGNKPLIRCLQALEPEQIGLLSGGALWEKLTRCAVEASGVKGGRGSQRAHWLADFYDALGHHHQPARAAFLDELHAEFVSAGLTMMPVDELRERWSDQRPLAAHLNDEDLADILRLHKIVVRNTTIHRVAIQRRLDAQD